jgi:hypothetical protein
VLYAPLRIKVYFYNVTIINVNIFVAVLKNETLLYRVSKSSVSCTVMYVYFFCMGSPLEISQMNRCKCRCISMQGDCDSTQDNPSCSAVTGGGMMPPGLRELTIACHERHWHWHRPNQSFPRLHQGPNIVGAKHTRLESNVTNPQMCATVA